MERGILTWNSLQQGAGQSFVHTGEEMYLLDTVF